MKNLVEYGAAFVMATALASAGTAVAQSAPAKEMTFFSNTGMSGGRFTVSGTRSKLDLPFLPRSVALQGDGKWEVCSEEDYRGRCETIVASQRDFDFGQVSSVRSAGVTTPAGQWREIARLNVRDRADRDVLPSNDRQTVFRQIKVCSERNTIRVRRAEAQLGNGQWQRLFIPLTLSQGECSNAIDLLGNKRRIRAVRFEYETWTVGMERGTVSVQALPQVTAQPR